MKPHPLQAWFAYCRHLDDVLNGSQDPTVPPAVEARSGLLVPPPSDPERRRSLANDTRVVRIGLQNTSGPGAALTAPDPAGSNGGSRHA